MGPGRDGYTLKGAEETWVGTQRPQFCHQPAAETWANLGLGFLTPEIGKVTRGLLWESELK